MRHLLWVALGFSGLVAGCDGRSDLHISSSSPDPEHGVLKVVDTLQCPQTEGVLTRKGSAQADGSTCTYAGPRGSEVQLQLLSLGGRTADVVLRDLESRLNDQMPESASTQARRKPPAFADGPDQADDAPATAAAEATASTSADDSAHVRLPGLSVDAQGDKATVRLPGIRVEADGNQSVVRIGGIVIRSDDQEQTSNVSLRADDGESNVSIQSDRNVTVIRAKAPGEAVRATYRLALHRNRGSQWQAVGYEARGPAGGPLVVATVRSRADDEDRVFDAAKTLVTLNVGK